MLAFLAYPRLANVAAMSKVKGQKSEALIGRILYNILFQEGVCELYA